MAYVNVAEWKPEQVCEWLKGKVHCLLRASLLFVFCFDLLLLSGRGGVIVLKPTVKIQPKSFQVCLQTCWFSYSHNT